MIDNNRIKHFLVQGLGPTEISSIVGCSPQYISALKKDPAFAASLESYQQVESSQEETKKSVEEVEEGFLANKYLALEHKCIEKLSASLPMAELKETIMTLRTIGERHNALRDRSLKARLPAFNPTNVQVAVITVKQSAIPEYTLNQQNEVVSIGSQPLASMTSNGVKSLFDQVRAMKLVEA